MIFVETRASLLDDKVQMTSLSSRFPFQPEGFCALISFGGKMSSIPPVYLIPPSYMFECATLLFLIYSTLGRALISFSLQKQEFNSERKRKLSDSAKRLLREEPDVFEVATKEFKGILSRT